VTRWGALAQFSPRIVVDLTDVGDQAPAYDPEALVLVDASGRRWTPQRWARPIPDGGTPPSLAAFADLIEEITQQRGWIALHCRAGIGRTGLVASGLLVRHGWSAEDAIECVDRLWRETPQGQLPIAKFLRSPETESQRDLVRAYAPIAPVGAPSGLAATAEGSAQ
jgi:hypothetical protein